MDSFERYARQAALQDFSEGAQDALKNSKLLLVGLGGVGSGALPLLAGAGVGEIVCVDCDCVSESNLHRQTLYTHEDLGKPKADAAKARAEKINPEVKITALNTRLEKTEDVLKLLEGCALCIDATDSFFARHLVARACEGIRLPEIMACAQGYSSQLACFGPGEGIGNLFKDESSEAEAAAGLPIFGPSAHLAGVMAAGIALRFLAGVELFPAGDFLSFDMKSMKFFKTNFRR